MFSVASKHYPKAPITNRTISVLTLCSVLITLAKSIYLSTFSCSLLTVLQSISITCHFLSPGIFITMSNLLCFVFWGCLNLYIPKDFNPCWVTVCGIGTCSYQFLVTFISDFLHNSQWTQVASRLCLII